MFIWCKDSSFQVMTNTHPDATASASLLLDSAKNMTVYGQVCLREHQDFSIDGAEFLSLPQGVFTEYYVAECITFNDGVPYPDILAKGQSTTVKAHYTQTLWVSLSVSENAQSGRYEIPFIVRTSLGEFTATLTLTVYSITIPNPKDAALGHEYFFSPYVPFPTTQAEIADKPFKAIVYSDEWWNMMKMYAQTMKLLRVNSLWLSTIPLLKDAGTKRVSETEWHFDFTLLDRFVQLYLDHGSFNRITLYALLDGADNKTVNGIDENGCNCKWEAFSKDAEYWATAYFQAIYKHFEEKGWLPLLCAHMQDEPHQKEYWQWSRDLCKKYMPNIPCSEPLDTHSSAKELQNLNLYVPRTDVYEPNAKFYKNAQKKGAELWVYTCCYPEESWWLNKFIDQPFAHSRRLSWACFSQGVDGFLHWGFNWYENELYGLCKQARFKGDGFIIYPTADGKDVLLSARGVNTIDGIYDYELLYLLAKNNPKKAKTIARRVSKNFVQFNPNSDCMPTARREILQLLETLATGN